MPFKYLLIAFTFLNTSLASFSQDDILSIFPDPFGLPGFQLAGDPEVYEGDYLYDLINGGADVYFEYGFERAATQSYKGVDGPSAIKIEIYQMSDIYAAYGIMSLTASGQSLIEKKGAFYVSGEGYKMIQKGPYFAMLSFANLSKDYRDGLITKISNDIQSKIKVNANYPAVLSGTKEPCPNFQRTLYFRGDIALKNATYVDFKIPFKYSEGVFYRCDVYDYIVFIPDGNQGKQEITQALINNILNTNHEFVPVKEAFGFSIQENEILRYEILPDGDRIVLIKYQ